MDPSKKRKAKENHSVLATSISEEELKPGDARKIIDAFSHDQLRDNVVAGICRRDPGLFVDICSIADRDPSLRKLFINRFQMYTTADVIRSRFSAYGEVDETIVIVEKATGRGKGYGFTTIRHVDSVLLALKEPSKKIDG